MGSSREPKSDGARVGPGPLVWVRRPNGSWWPGVVLSPDEVEERRKGTPVKLLGREDGNMDWYDLDKSKRIKAFRCGEYDECIEKARASGSRSNKIHRIGKYARRGDAILHALKLESAYYANGASIDFEEQNNMAMMTNKQGIQTTELSQSVISCENNSSSSRLNIEKESKWRTQSDSEDDSTVGTKHVRDLQDLGIVHKRQLHTVGGTNLHKDAIPDSASPEESNISCYFSHLSQDKGNKYSRSSLKRKPLMAQFNEVFKRKNRCRPLTKVLEYTERIAVPSSCSQECCSSRSSLQQCNSAALDSSESRKTDLSVVIDDRSHCSDNSREENSDAHEGIFVAASEECFSAFDSKDNGILEATVDDGDESFYGLVEVATPMGKNCTYDYSQLVTSCVSNRQTTILNKKSKFHNGDGKSSDKKETNNDCITPPIQQLADDSNRHFKGGKNFKCLAILSKKPTDSVDPTECSLTETCFHGDTSPALFDGITLNGSFISTNDGNMGGCGLLPCEMMNVTEEQILEVPNLHYDSKLLDFGSKQLIIDSSNQFSNQRSATCEKTRESTSTSMLSNHSRLSKKFTPQKQFQHYVDYQDIKFGDRTSSNYFLHEVNIDVQPNYKENHAPLVSLLCKSGSTAVIGHPVIVEAMKDCSLFLLNTVSSCNGTSKTGFMQRRTNCQRRRKTSRSKCRLSKRKPSKMKKKSPLISRKIRKLSSITENEKDREPLVEKFKGSIISSCIPINLVFRRITEGLVCSSLPTCPDVSSAPE